MQSTQICSFPDCGRPATAKSHDLCAQHRVLQRKGQPLRPLRTLFHGCDAERLAHYTQKRGPSECWPWLASRMESGHGEVWSRDHGRVYLAHRRAYELANGPIPDGMMIDHMCRNPPCVNPAHLQLATMKTNQENLTGARSHSKTGVRGVSPFKGKFRATVNHNQRQRHIGTFDTVEEAEVAVIEARNKFFTNNLLDRERAADGDIQAAG